MREQTTSLRFYLICLLITAACLWPSLAELQDIDIGTLARLMNIPNTGLLYMGVFFHEIGHTVTNFLFGYIAFPTFDFAHGGGMTYSGGERHWLLQGIGLLAMAGIIGLLFVERYYGLMIGAGMIAIIYAALAFTEGYQSAILFMGYGTEVLIAVFCLHRAMTGGAVNKTEQYLNMIFGLHVLGRNAILLGGLYYSEVARMAYSMQKGQEMAGDFDRLADLMNSDVKKICIYAILFMILTLIGAFVWQKTRPLE